MSTRPDVDASPCWPEPAVIAMESGGMRGVVAATVVDISRGSAALDGFGLGDRVPVRCP